MSVDPGRPIGGLSSDNDRKRKMRGKTQWFQINICHMNMKIQINSLNTGSCHDNTIIAICSKISVNLISD